MQCLGYCSTGGRELRGGEQGLVGVWGQGGAGLLEAGFFVLAKPLGEGFSRCDQQMALDRVESLVNVKARGFVGMVGERIPERWGVGEIDDRWWQKAQDSTVTVVGVCLVEQCLVAGVVVSRTLSRWGNLRWFCWAIWLVPVQVVREGANQDALGFR